MPALEEALGAGAPAVSSWCSCADATLYRSLITNRRTPGKIRSAYFLSTSFLLLCCSAVPYTHTHTHTLLHSHVSEPLQRDQFSALLATSGMQIIIAATDRTRLLPKKNDLSRSEMRWKLLKLRHTKRPVSPSDPADIWSRAFPSRAIINMALHHDRYSSVRTAGTAITQTDKITSSWLVGHNAAMPCVCH